MNCEEPHKLRERDFSAANYVVRDFHMVGEPVDFWGVICGERANSLKTIHKLVSRDGRDYGRGKSEAGYGVRARARK